MNTKESSIKKMCSFYVSDWHLTTMILPYISNLMENDTEIETILEQGIESNIQELTSKLNMNPDKKQKILNINWNATNTREIKTKHNNKGKVILVNGTKERIEEINQLLEKEMDPEEKENTTILNCYDAIQTKESIEEILNKHQSIMNTSGEHTIGEVFSFLEN